MRTIPWMPTRAARSPRTPMSCTQFLLGKLSEQPGTGLMSSLRPECPIEVPHPAHATSRQDGVFRPRTGDGSQRMRHAHHLDELQSVPACDQSIAHRVDIPSAAAPKAIDLVNRQVTQSAASASHRNAASLLQPRRYCPDPTPTVRLPCRYRMSFQRSTSPRETASRSPTYSFPRDRPRRSLTADGHGEQRAGLDLG